MLQDLDHFNDFFIEKEEECIIRTQALTEQLPKAEGDRNFSSRLRSAFVDLHGEGRLLWSSMGWLRDADHESLQVATSCA